MNFEPFRQNLRDLISSRGVLVKDVAKQIGTAPETMSRYLSGSRTPDLEYAIRLAHYFDVPFMWLLGLEDNDNELVSLYNLATPSDRQVINLILEKYKG